MASSKHRLKLIAELPWTWSLQNDAELTPENCANCRYYKRSQPWAHLRFVDQFSKIYNDKSFVTPPRPASSLNKITPFLLRELLNEAGFRNCKVEANTIDISTGPRNIRPWLLALDLDPNNSDALYSSSGRIAASPCDARLLRGRQAHTWT